MQWPLRNSTQESVAHVLPRSVERWETVLEASDYEVSSFGRIRRRATSSYPLWEIIPQMARTGYLKVRLTVDGKTKGFLVHRLVAKAFCKNPEAKPFVNHIDLDKTNNVWFNLEWTTPFENYYHAAQAGAMKGKRLTLEEVSEIRNLFRKGVSQTKLASKFGIARTSIRRIVNGDVYA